MNTAEKMHSVADVLPGALNSSTLVCKNCGEKVEFAAKQWRRPCRCGIIITLPEPYKRVKEEEDQMPACFICYDRGMVHYKEQIGDKTYEYVARCICQSGQNRTKKGICKVDEVDNICNLQYLEMKNRRMWEKRTGRKADVALFSQSETVDVNTDDIPF
ncbi:MAG: hypothetical protein MJA84_00335 [Firmicutes bacterium]|nr:hypothetical protein [Bacillota bacterium]